MKGNRCIRHATHLSHISNPDMTQTLMPRLPFQVLLQTNCPSCNQTNEAETYNIYRKLQ